MSRLFVLDTNVLVSAALGDGPARRLLVFLSSTGRLATSHFIIEELAAVLLRPPLGDRIPQRVVAGFVSFVERHAFVVRPGELDWPRNPKDALVVATALEAKATLVTGDKLVWETAGHFGVRALSLREALDGIVEE